MSLKKLVESHQKFKEKYHKKYYDMFRELVEKGQSPKSLFIGCSDSRVVPNLITSTDPGELFVIRNVGNFVPPFRPDSDYHGTAAAIEYAVSVLKVENVIVCGHTHCGACEHLYHAIPDDPELIHVKKWLEIAEPVKAHVLQLHAEDDEIRYRMTEKFNIIEQLFNLFSYPAIQRRALEGNLTLQGWYYHIQSGEIEYFNPETNAFESVTDTLQP